MDIYIPRLATQQILELSTRYPAVALVGPRQVGKTSLVKKLRDDLARPSIYLDLEYPPDYNKLTDPIFFLEALQDQTVIIDEVQRMPSLFPLLRSLIDRNRKPGRFILLGSAAPDMIRDTSESLAGRVAYYELAPLLQQEIQNVAEYRQLWSRGGFPRSILAEDDAASLDWRQNFIQSYLERDIPLLGLKADPMLIRRLWTMLAHVHGQLLNMQSLSRSLGISSPTVRKYIDFLESAYLIRRLYPYSINVKKRLVKSPKVYIRDSGILHALLNLATFTEVTSHPVAGSSWEGYIIQQLAAYLPPRTDMYFYRTQDGTEADLIMVAAGQPKASVEIKLTTSPKVSRGFRQTMVDLEVDKGYIICPVTQSYPLAENIEVLSPDDLSRLYTQ